MGTRRAAQSGVALFTLCLISIPVNATVIHRDREAPARVACDSDSDCPPGLGCVPDAEPGLGDEPDSWCLPRLCEEDGHCDAATICLSVPPGPCPDEELCESAVQQICGPPWLAPCVQDSDCGHPDIRCMEQMSCTDGGAPSRGEDGETIEAECEALGVFHCEFDIQLCKLDQDCPDDWRCFEAVGGEISVNYEVPCPDEQRDGRGDQCLLSGGPPEGEAICLPKDYRAYVGWDGGVAPQATSEGEPVEDAGPPSDSGNVEPPESSTQISTGDSCSAGGESPWVRWSLLSLLSLLWILWARRLKAVSFGGRMRGAHHRASLTFRGD